MFTEIDIRFPALNLILRERLDPFLDALCRVWGMDYRLYPAGQVLIMLLGAYWLFLITAASRRRAAWFALLFAAGSIAASGAGLASLKIHWLPFFLAGAVRLLAHPAPGAYVLAGACTLAWSLTSGPLAASGAMFVLIYAFFCPEAEGAKGRPLRFLSVLSAAAFLWGLIGVPVYQMPAYPPAARLAPASPFMLYERPFIGPYFEPFPLVYEAYIGAVREHSLRFFAACAVILLSFVFFSKMRLRAVMHAGGIMLGTLLFVSGEWLLRGDMSFAAPFPVFARFVPGLAISPLPWLLAPFGCLAALRLLAADSSQQQAPPRRLISLDCCAALLLVVIISLLLPFDTLSGEVSYLRAPARAADPQEQLRFSPSGFLVDAVGDWAAQPGVAQKRDLKELHRLRPGADFSAQLQASVKQEAAALALDGDDNTRWSTMGPQRPGQSFEVLFAQPVEIVRLALSVMTVPTDFPRGIEVWAGSSPESAQLMISQPSWLGAVQWSPGGYPYFGPQSTVLIDFAKQERVQYLKFVQTGEAPFDWSISELKFFKFAD